MSKELPFFKFDPSEWLIGKISFQPVELQGAFVQCCCVYWKQGGKMKDADVDFRIGKEFLQKLKELQFLKEIDGDLHISFLDNQLEECQKMRATLKEIGSKGGRKSASLKGSKRPSSEGIAKVKRPSSDPQATLDQPSSDPQLSKSKSKSKSKNKEGEEKKDKFPPTVEEVIFYFKENGYTSIAARKAFKYYNDANWIDSKGNKVLSWKQKMISVWFKEENLEPVPVIKLDVNRTMQENNNLFG